MHTIYQNSYKGIYMKSLSKILLLSGFVSTMSFANEQQAKFEISLLKQGEMISTTTLISAFDQANTLKIDEKLKVALIAQKPTGTKSKVSVQVSFFNGEKMVQERSNSMVADLSLTPSFQMDSTSSDYRVEIKPRFVN